MSATDVDGLVAGLNEEQRRAVLHTDGPLLILAGAGSGKTRVLIRRLANLLASGVRPHNILAVTFTNKAAGEMRARVRDLVGPDADRVLVSTFHSACVRFLRQDIEHLGWQRNFTIYDTDDQRRLVKNLCKEQGVDIKAWPVAKVRSIIDQAKVKMQDPDAFSEMRRAHPGDPMVRLYRAYADHMRLANALDFNDLLNHTVALLTEHPAVLARYRERFRYVMVDEYQDTNRAQYLLLKLLAGEHRNLAVVGDDDQSIYAFRGADVRNILDFEKDFPEATTVRLERNYRSTSNILEAAHGVVKNNRGRMDKKLWTDTDGGDKVQIFVAADEMDEAARVLRDIQAQRRTGRSWSDFAIMYRTNAASRPFEQNLVRARIPHILVGARKFYERREIRDLLSYLKLILNPTDDMAFLRVINVPTRGIGAVALKGITDTAQSAGVPLAEGAKKWATVGKGRGRAGAKAFSALIERAREEAIHTAPGALVSMIAEESGYAAQLRAEDTPEAMDRLENIGELARAMEEDAEVWKQEEVHPLDRLRAFVDRACLVGQDEDLPDFDPGEGQITLLTAHLAKGLEFPVVYCTGMTEGGFPHHRSREREEDLEEERRLVYVAFTRAMKRLVLTRARRRLVMGTGFQPAEPSRFLSEIPDAVLEGDKGQVRPAWAQRFNPGVPRPRPVPEPAQRPSDLRTMEPEDAEAFQPGIRVMHPTFGLGVIRRVDGQAENLKLQISFDRQGTKSVYARFAKLEVVLS